MKFSQFPSNVKLRIICGFFDQAANMSVMPFMVLYLADELGKVTSGILLVVNVIFNLICNLFSGYFADRFNRKRQLIIGQALFAVVIALMAVFIHPAVNMPYIVAFLFMMIALCWAMIFPALEALIIDSTTEDIRKHVFVFSYWSSNLSTAVGTALGGLFYKEHRLTLFIIIVVIVTINTLIFYKFLDDPTTRREKKIVEAHWIRDLISNYMMAVRDHRFVVFTLAAIFIFSAEFALTNYVGVRLHEVFKPFTLFGVHIDGVRMMSLLLIENTLLVVTLTFFINKLMEGLNQQVVLLLGAFLYTASYGLTHHLTTWYLLVIVSFTATIGELMFSPIYSVFQAKLMPEDKRASYLAFSFLGFSGAQLIASAGLIIGTVLNSVMMSAYVIVLGLIGMLLLYLSVHTNLFNKEKPL